MIIAHWRGEVLRKMEDGSYCVSGIRFDAVSDGQAINVFKQWSEL